MANQLSKARFHENMLVRTGIWEPKEPVSERILSKELKNLAMRALSWSWGPEALSLA
jgi:hypothetical protein